jgi:16S rRNA processing protein RimM
MATRWIEIGRVRSVNPARRELRVRAARRHAHELDAPQAVRVQIHGAEPVRCVVESVRPAGGEFVMRLAPGVLRDTVAEMKSAALVLAPDELSPRPEGAVHASDLIGVQVYEEGQTAPLGRVTAAYETNANEVLEIERDSGGTVLLPFIDALVASVDLDREVLVVRDIGPHVAVDED